MIRNARPTPLVRRVRRHATLIAGALAAGLAIGAVPAQAATHDYCNWDGSSVTPAAWALCTEPSTHNITENYAYLTGASDTFIYCGASLNGTQYGSNNVGSPDCTHAYSGANALKAHTYVGPNSRTLHGIITY